jgi:hypothetical protein
MLRTERTALTGVRKNEVPVELLDLHVPTQEWHAILTVRPNVLVEGSDHSTEKIVRAVTAASDGPIYEWENGPAQGEPARTMIVRRIDLFSASEHRRLLDFLNTEGARTQALQVIATSERPLYTLVESGLFLADLYYRLNTIRLELAEHRSQDPV